MMDIEPYQKYFTGQKPDLLGHTIIGIAASLKIYCVNAPKPPPAEAFYKISSACDLLDEESFDAAVDRAFKIFFEPHLTNADAAWLEIARLIETKAVEKFKQVTKAPILQTQQPATEETPPHKESKTPAPEHISTILPRIHLPPPGTLEEIKPELPRAKKRFSLKIAMRLCVPWILDPRWQKLTPCAELLFYRLIFRTYRKQVFLKIKQAIAKGETYFPWCCTGIKSLSKQLTYRPPRSNEIKHYGERQIRRALRQLWDLAFIHRIFRGYEDQGAGKYHVFLNPKMSATFNQARVKTKRALIREKRHYRMS